MIAMAKLVNTSRRDELRKAVEDGKPVPFRREKSPLERAKAVQTPPKIAAAPELDSVETANARLFSAVKRRDLDAAEDALTDGANPNATEPVLKGERMMISIQHGMWVNAGATPLLIAVGQVNRDMAELLILRGADVNLGIESAPPGAFTPLAVCRETGNLEMRELLLKHGARE